MRIGRRPHRAMRILREKGQILEQEQDFKYLGTWINESGYIYGEISQRQGAAGRMFNAVRKGFLSKVELTKKTMISVYNSTFLTPPNHEPLPQNTKGRSKQWR